jgi:hypothetical protein
LSAYFSPMTLTLSVVGPATSLTALQRARLAG